MVALVKTKEAIPAGGTTREYGTAYFDGTEWWANVRGGMVMARWNKNVQPVQGGSIVVDITSDGRGLATGLVICEYGDQPAPSTGSVLAVGVDQIVFTGDDGGNYTTKSFLGPSTDYAPGNPVKLSWASNQPTILGVIAAINAPPIQPPVPPPAAPTIIQSGQETLVATASDTYGVGGWGRWAQSTNGGEQLYSGSLGGQVLTGSWFYGPPRPALQGKTISRVQFRVPARLNNVGNYNAPATMHVYVHTSQYRPGGDVGRTMGPFDVVLAVGQSPAWIDLPAAVGPVIAAGGGISIAGDPYIGLNGRRNDPESGKLLMDWNV
ncbi:hypothetical protein [Paenarthrobacter ilicis]|uniref:hypothetical protein n=1 Tax=Paenarthrobacter ilicis TaxID=43665 RepID=UPI0028D0520F|nr:hypothetical protein [Paenarthrobacter ilicis]